MSVVMYHNPRCATSRKALELLRSKGVEPTIVEYLKTPPNVGELKKLLDMLRMTPRELIRDSEMEYKALRLDKPDISDARLIQAMVAKPVLIERPVVVKGNRAVLGRPAENVLDILDIR